MATVFDFLGVTALALIAVMVGLALREVQQRREDQIRLDLLRLFGPARDHVQKDPRELIVWYPLARAARRLWPEACRTLDVAMGETFPFSGAQLEEAHARWTADWLLWERQHDAEYKKRAAVPAERAVVEALEREKLETYQERYAQYVRVGKALAALERPT